MTLLAERPADEVDESELVVGRRIQEFSQLAGPVRELDGDPADYRVSYRGVDAVHGKGRVWRSLLVAGLNFAFEALFFLWLLHPSHRPPVDQYAPAFATYANWVVIGSIGLMELLRLINVFSLSLASVISRDPVPVPPVANQRVAFLTTIVPSKEPIDVVRGTLQAALRIRYQGILDVWILDEGDDPAVRAMCRELGVNHFTRKGIEKYNRKKGAFKAKTKHGNYNAWVAEHGDSYEIFLSVDPDHVPLPNYAERILGYFRDPDVAYVVGPQCYANDETFVTRAAESQQFPFHSLIQRAANRYNAAMLVGTNNAIRISALKGIGGLSDSVTEDMATGLKFHVRRNPQTKARWKSVYTPDVLAVGEGPSSWGDFFSQQMRWSRGTFEVLLTEFWRRLPMLSPGRALHYILITTFYPSMAIGWILGAVNAVLFLALGVQGVVVPVQLWLALYVDATAFQLWVYLRNRRYNVSPYEAEGSSGVKGMLMSIFASPIFAASLIATILRLPAKFVVTPKGLSSSADHVLTFRRHLQWAVLLLGAIITSIFMGYATPAVLLWPFVALCACLAPPALWIVERVVGRQPVITAEPSRTSDGRTGITTESLQRAALDAMIAEGPASAPFRSPLVGKLPEGWIRTGDRRVPAGVGAGPEAPRTEVAGERYRPLPAGWVRQGEPGAESPAGPAPVSPAVGTPSPGPRTPNPGPRPVRPAAEAGPGGPRPRPVPGPTPGQPPVPPAGQPGQPAQPGQPGQPGNGQGPRPAGPAPRPTPVPRTTGPRPTPQPGRPTPAPPERPAAEQPPARPTPRPDQRPEQRPEPVRPVRPEPHRLRPAAAGPEVPETPESPAAPTVHRNGITPIERRSRTTADGRPARPATPGEPAADATPAVNGSNGTHGTNGSTHGTNGASSPGAPANGTPVNGRPVPATNGTNGAGHTEVTPRGGEDAPDDGLTTSERALHASTVAVRVVALAAVAPPAGRSDDARRRVRQPEQTEAS
ncbi:glycosyltransferase family 2 protein [Actinomycetospora soli]|uniref:glycosyltransferase family 2 protein n=1 Tax=Actinomycetospora soli TaxID=2893887 RepID=UPI001E3C9E76|nr:cellulose synthase catalytic subunit [Actinomycetospora soli]MCD2186391.1 glycosyltransferase [Actinomycetospora soli]